MAESNPENVPSTGNHGSRAQQPFSSQVDNDTDNTDGRNILSELVYCFESFHAIFPPVSITMILSALAVVHINTEETRALGAEAYSKSYTVIELEDGNSGQNLIASLGNTFIMVSVICVMTFGIVALYKYRCMKILSGYLVVSMAALLGYVTGVMWKVAIDKYQMRVDKVTYYWFLFNYAIVGTLAIFWGQGIPRWVTQGYLVAASVVLSWQLSYFDEWTAWTGLVMLALYDLFAVLTPCGPLKALVNQMQRSNAPELPSLLYEARLPAGVARPRNNDNNNHERRLQQQAPQQQQQSHQSRDEEVAPRTVMADGVTLNNGPASAIWPADSTGSESPVRSRNDLGKVDPQNGHQRVSNASIEMTVLPLSSLDRRGLANGSIATDSQPTTTRLQRSVEEVAQETNDAPVFFNHEMESLPMETGSSLPQNAPVSGGHAAPDAATGIMDLDVENRPRGRIPLAIAKIYKLMVIDEDGVLQPQTRGRRRRNNNAGTTPCVHTPEQVRSTAWTPRQLRSEVTVTFPRGGGSIRRSEEATGNDDDSNGAEYIVYNRRGEVVTTYTVNQQGEVLRVVRRGNPEGDGDDPTKDNIKLGLVRRGMCVSCFFFVRMRLCLIFLNHDMSDIY
jgi:hypothetical protein